MGVDQDSDLHLDLKPRWKHQHPWSFKGVLYAHVSITKT